MIESMFTQKYNQSNDEILVNALGILGNISEIDQNIGSIQLEKHSSTIAK